MRKRLISLNDSNGRFEKIVDKKLIYYLNTHLNKMENRVLIKPYEILVDKPLEKVLEFMQSPKSELNPVAI